MFANGIGQDKHRSVGFVVRQCKRRIGLHLREGFSCVVQNVRMKSYIILSLCQYEVRGIQMFHNGARIWPTSMWLDVVADIGGHFGVRNEASVSGVVEGSGYLRKVATKAIGLIFLDLAAHYINNVAPDKKLAHVDPRGDTC